MTLAAIVVFTTTYAMILPALSMDVVVAQQDSGIGLESEDTTDFSSEAQTDADTGTASAGQNTDTGEAQTPTAADTDSASTGTEPETDDDFSTEEPAVVEQQTTADAAASTLTAEIPGATVTLAFDPEAGVPEGTILTVTALTQEEAGAYRNAAQEKADASVFGSNVTTAQFYRLALTHDGETVTPAGNADIHVDYAQNPYLEQDETAYAVVYTGEASSYHTLLLSRNSDGTATVAANNGAITAADLKDYSISRYGDVFGIVSVKAPAAENGDEAGADDNAAADAIEDTAAEAEKNSKETVDVADDIDTEKVNDNLAAENETQGTDATAEEGNTTEDEEAVEDEEAAEKQNAAEDEDAVEEKKSVEGEAAAEDKEATEDQNAEGDAAEAENTIEDENAAEEKDPSEDKDIAEDEDAAEGEVAAAADETDAQDSDSQDTEKKSEDFDAPESLTEEDAQAGLTELDLGDVVIRPVDEELLLPADTEGHAEVLEGTEADEAQTAVEDYVNEQNALKASKMKKAAKRQTLAAATATADQNEQAYQVFDIALENVDAEEYKGGFEVEVSLPENIIGKDFHLYHIHDGETEEIAVDLDKCVLDEASGVSVVSGFTFETANFSEFVLKYTVDFEYNGYTFSMPGGGVLLMSELFKALGIEEDVADVEDVTFTDYSLLQVEKLEAGDSYRKYIDIYGDFTEEDLDNLEPFTVISRDKLPVDRVVRTDNWLLTSLKSFTTDEILSITMKDGNLYIINVTDDLSLTNGNVAMQDIATVRTSASKKVTQTEQERNATFDFNLGVLLTKAGLTDLQDYVRANNQIPPIVYDFSSIVAGSPIDGMISASVTDLKDDGVTVGTVTIDPSGKVIIQYTDPAYILRKTAIAANVALTVRTNEQYIPSNDEYTWNFPDSNSVTVHYKKNYITEAKKYELQGDGSTGYTATYTAKFTSTSNMDSLKFTDTLGGDDLQTLDDGSIRITRGGTDVTGEWTKKDVTSKGFTLENTNHPAAGEYVVTYSTRITAEQYAAMQEGTNSQETNSARWNLNGNQEIPGGDTSFNIDKPKPPEPPVTVEKSSNVENQEVSRDSDIYYTVRYTTTKLNGLRITDKMTDVQILDPSSVVVKVNDQTIATPSGFLNYYNDNSFNQYNMTNVFDYTFPEDGPYPKNGNYTVEVTYKTTLIDQETAKANNIFDGVSVENVAEEGRYWTNDKTTSTVTYDKEIIHSVEKAATPLSVDTEGNWDPGTTVTYRIKVGDGTTDLGDTRIVDKMTGLQKLNAGSVQISYDNGSSYSALTSGVVYDFSQQYTTNEVDVLDLVLPDSAGYGPIYITYTTTVMSQAEAAALGIYDPKQVNNNVSVGGKGHDGTSGNVPYEPEPKFPVTKTLEIDADQKEESGATKLGGRVHYHLTFGDVSTDMAGVSIRDEMTDVQKLVGDVVVTLPSGLTSPVTLQNGTVLPVGTDHFVMPTSSSVSSNDGVVWSAWLDNGQYDINSYVRVFYYTFPEGIGNGPIRVDYAVDVITEEEAKNAGINDTHNAYNTAYAGNNQVTTEFPIDFPKNLPHTPQVEKKWVGWDFANKAVNWDIEVDKTADSAYPIPNVKVTEVLNNSSYVNSSEINNTGRAIMPDNIDMVNAVLETASGNTLVMGEDYEIFKGIMPESGYNVSYGDEPYFLIYNLTEKVTIHLSYHTDLSIIDGFVAYNRVTVEGGNDSTANKTYEAPHFTVSKTGEIVSTPDQPDLKNRVIKWTVMINPTKMEVTPDTHNVMFTDIIPDGLKLINYSKWNSGNNVNNEGSIYIGYAGEKYSGTGREETVTPIAVDGVMRIQSVTINPTYEPYNPQQPASVNLNKQRYDVVYYTYIDDTEWERITSSADGSKTYPNKAIINVGDITETGETEVTIKSTDYISKTDTTIESTYQGVDGKTHTGVVGEDGKGSDYISYRIEINSSAAALNRVEPENPGDTVTYDPITLTDRIDTNMDFDPSTLKIYTYGSQGTKANKEAASDTLTEITSGLVVSYNDDTRVLAIAGFTDKTAYRIEYKNKVRTQGTDTFTNTATLTGGGSHSSTVTETHKFENVTDDGTSYDMELDLHKIKETDITKSLAGVTFELHQLELAIDPFYLTDEYWEQLFTDTNNGVYSDEVLANFKKTNNILLETITTGADGIAKFPTGRISIQPKTVYYWIETANANPDYEPENVPHYFVLYPDKEIIYDKEQGKYIKVLLGTEEKTKQQHIAWALDNAYQKANGVTVASMSSGVTWSVNNLEKEFTTISATKSWEGDANNLFETRPDKGIKLTLYQKFGVDGDWVVYNPKTETPRINMNPVTIRGSEYTYTDASGKVIATEEWPKANWIRLPAYKTERIQEDGLEDYRDVIVGYYYYKVVEEPVENYTTTYTTNNTDENGNTVDPITDGIKKGTVAITNTYIPPTTSIGVHKTFRVASGTNLPEQIVVKLYQIRKDADGKPYPATDYGMTRMLSATNNWSEIFKGLPTRDSNGNTFSYTILEDTDALEDDGFAYTLTEYVPDGQVDDETGGMLSGTMEIVNHGKGSLKIQKNVSINNEIVEIGDSGADGTYTFHILKDGVEITDTNPDGAPKSPVTITIENGASNSAIVSNLDAGEYTIHEDAPANGTSLLGSNDVKVKVIGGVDDPSEAETASFTNNIDKTRVKVKKVWVNANRDDDGNIINGTNNDWPRGVTVQVTLKKTNNNGSTKESVSTPSWYNENGVTWNDTLVLSSVRQMSIFDNLDQLAEGYVYTVEETVIGADGRVYDQHIGELEDELDHLCITNAERTQAEFTKVWDNTTGETGGSEVYKRGNLTIKVRLHQYYQNADGVETESAASVDGNSYFAVQTMTETSQIKTTVDSVTIQQTSTSGDDKWKLLWGNLPSTGEENGNYVTYYYKVEETAVEMNSTSVADQFDTTVSEDGLTITNKYKNGTSVAVEKMWSDGKTHNDDTVEVTLYQSNIAPYGEGTPYSSTVNVGSWLDANGGSASAPSSGNITVTFTPEGGDTPVETLTLSDGKWSQSTGDALKKGINYTVAFAGDGTNVLGVGSASISGTNVTLTGVVPAASNKVSVGYIEKNAYLGWNGESNDYGDKFVASKTADTTLSTVTVKFFYWSNNCKIEDLAKITLEGSGATITQGTPYYDGSIYKNIKEFTISGIQSNVILTINYGESGKTQVDDIEIVTSDGAGSSSFTGADPITLYQGNSSDYSIPEYQGNWTQVTGVTNPVTLNLGALSGKWFYEWAALPDSDANGPLYYYVKETSHSGSTDTVGDPQYDFEFRNTEPKTITKVKITNTVKGGELNVTKAATFTPSTDAYANKTYSFTVKENDSGKYLQNTDGTLDTNKKWFSVKSGETIKFPNLPVGTYTVEEDVAGSAISGYNLSASGDGELTVNVSTPVTSTLRNDYTKEYGSIIVKKTTLVSNGTSRSADTTVENKTVTIGLFDTLPTEESTPTKTATITLGANGTGSDSTTFTNLELGQTYYVYELDVNNHPALLTGGKSSINSVEYEVSQDKTSAALSTTVKTATVEITNTREELTGSLKITKAVQLNGTDTTDIRTNGTYTFQVFESDGTTAAIKKDGTAITSPLQITVTVGVASPAELIVDGLEPGNYVVKETASTNGGMLLDSDKTVTVRAGSEIAAMATAAFVNNYETTTISAIKTWGDGNSTPPSGTEITWTIAAKDSDNRDVTATVLPTEADRSKTSTASPWTEQWQDLPGVIGGKAVTYNVTETSAKYGGYTYSEDEIAAANSGVDTTTADTFAFTNQLPKITLSGTKTWIDGTGTNRPIDLTITLYKVTGTAPSETETVVATQTSDNTAAGYLSWNKPASSNTWTYSIINLPKYDADGTVIKYRVKETVPTNYKATNESADGIVDSTTGNISGANFTNTEITKVSVTKKWTLNDVEMTDPGDVNSITVHLYRKNGEDIEIDSITKQPVESGQTARPFTISRTLKSGSESEYEWKTLEVKGLDKYYVEGSTQKEYEYYFREDAVTGYNESYKAGSKESAKVGSSATVKGDGTVTITNAKYTVSLPATGGSGTRFYHVFGLAMILFAGAMLLIKRKSGLDLIPENK